MTANMTRAQLKKVNTKRLWEMLREATVDTLDGIRRMAMLWTELQNRGADMSAFNGTAAAHFFPKIASGKLRPEAFLMFSHSRSMLDCMANLLPEVQQKLFDSPKPSVPVRQSDGSIKNVPLLELPVRCLPQVFTKSGTIRTPAQQAHHMIPGHKISPPSMPEVKDQVLFNALELNQDQRTKLKAAAAELNVSCTRLVMRLLVENDFLDEAPAPRQRTASASLAA